MRSNARFLFSLIPLALFFSPPLSDGGPHEPGDKIRDAGFDALEFRVAPTLSLFPFSPGRVRVDVKGQLASWFVRDRFIIIPAIRRIGHAGFVHHLGIYPVSQFGTNLLSIPAPNTETTDKNLPRIAQRNLFDLSIGDDNLFSFRNDRYKVSARLTVINIANKNALYNFLSTFSGTHYVTPRTVTAELGFHF